MSYCIQECRRDANWAHRLIYHSIGDAIPVIIFPATRHCPLDSTHFPTRRGTRLSWPEWLTKCTHKWSPNLSINQAQRRVTLLMLPTPLALGQTGLHDRPRQHFVLCVNIPTSLPSKSRSITIQCLIHVHHTHAKPFYGPFSGTTRVSRCQKRTSGLHGVRGD